MRTSVAIIALASLLLAAGCGPSGSDGPARAAGQGGQSMDRAAHAEAVIHDWPAESRDVARDAIVMYGPPHEVTESRLIWHDAGAWKRVIAYREVVEHDFPGPHIDVLEGFVDYRIPAERVGELARFTGSVYVDRTKGELSARCDREVANFLSVNLAHEILGGERTAEEARQVYTDAMAAFKAHEEVHPYMERFLFRTPQPDTPDPDVPTIVMD